MSPEMHETNVNRLIDLVYDYFKSINDPSLARFLKNWPLKPFKLRKVSLRLYPVLSYLPEICVKEHGKSAQVVKALQVSAVHLGWGQTYVTEDFGEAFLTQYVWTELIGTRGPVVSRDIACGFLLLGPDIEYPRHSHDAEEIYLPLNSGVLSILGEEGWMPENQGVPIYHRPQVVHGLKTGSSPFLTLYIWQGGDLAQKSHIKI